MSPEKVEAVEVPEPFDLVIHDPMGKSEFQPMDCGLIWVLGLEHKFFEVQYIYVPNGAGLSYLENLHDSRHESTQQF